MLGLAICTGRAQEPLLVPGRASATASGQALALPQHCFRRAVSPDLNTATILLLTNFESSADYASG